MFLKFLFGFCISLDLLNTLLQEIVVLVFNYFMKIIWNLLDLFYLIIVREILNFQINFILNFKKRFLIVSPNFFLILYLFHVAYLQFYLWIAVIHDVRQYNIYAFSFFLLGIIFRNLLILPQKLTFEVFFQQLLLQEIFVLVIYQQEGSQILNLLV